MCMEHVTTYLYEIPELVCSFTCVKNIFAAQKKAYKNIILTNMSAHPLTYCFEFLVLIDSYLIGEWRQKKTV